uniref:Uncharacterized protein n=1 Tax=Megaselia scalaris TaxID=36166 RepID=T1H043_MEGSC
MRIIKEGISSKSKQHSSRAMPCRVLRSIAVALQLGLSSSLASLSTRSTHLVRLLPLLLVPSTFEDYTFLSAVLASIRSK